MNKNKNANLVTKEGYDNFIEELNHLKSVGRIEAANAIRLAAEQGDLSENAEYDAAKEAQSLLERRIVEIEEFLKNCEIVEATNDDNITVGKTITLVNNENGENHTLKLVGNNEADPFSMKISIASPIGKEIFGKKTGDTIIVNAPIGQKKYTITNVTVD